MTGYVSLTSAIATLALVAIVAGPAAAQERLPWEKQGYGVEPPPTGQGRPYAARERRPADPYSPGAQPESPAPERASPPSREPRPRSSSPSAPRYQPPRYQPSPRPQHAAPYRDERDRAYEPPSRYRDDGRYADPEYNRGYSENEILDAGHRFFGSVSKGLAQAVAKLFKQAGRPNGFILGEDAGGAFIAGLRYGEGTLYTKHAGSRRVYWQGPTVGYDFGGEGSRTMVLVYNLDRPSQIFRRYGGVQGSAYIIGGVSVQLLKHGDVTLAPIRSGVGLRLGANVGYLKYTPRPTWNPF